MTDQPDVEEWRDVPTWEDQYQVSNRGRIRSKSRTVTRRNGSSCTVRGKVLKTFTRKSGHLQTSLASTGRRAAPDVHILVAATFLGPCPDGMEVRHLNGDPTDNRPENLRYGTRAENVRDAFHHGTTYAQSKDCCPNGHAYEGKNLKAYKTPQGNYRRYCRACSNAHLYAKRYGMTDRKKEIADRYYASYTPGTTSPSPRMNSPS